MSNKFIIPLRLSQRSTAISTEKEDGFIDLYLLNNGLVKWDGISTKDVTLDRLLENYSLAETASNISDTDSVLLAFGKLQKQIIDIGGGGSPNEFLDSLFRLQDNIDITKEISFELSGITTGTTRVVTFPDKDGVMAFMSDIITDHTSMSNIGTNTHAQIDSHIADADKHREINDGGLSTTDLWSANQINSELNSKVDTEVGKGLSANDYTDLEKTKLSNIEDNATADQTGSEIKIAYEGESNTNAFTDAEKTKLSGLESSKFLGAYPTLLALNTAHPTGVVGNYADVDAGIGNDVKRYIWDDDDNAFVEQLGASAALSDAQIKTQYENNADTNAYTDTEKSKLASITAIFTTALKTAYDTASTWIVTNGTNVLNHLSNTSNPHSVTKTQVGLSNVDNTSDVNKPISNATQTALDDKVNKATLPVTIGFQFGLLDTDLEVGDGDWEFPMPFGMTLTGAFIVLKVGPTGSTAIFDIVEGGTTILSTLASIDVGETSTETAATPLVISDTTLAAGAIIGVNVDQLGSTIKGQEGILWLLGTRSV